jgi:hypothetical protein
MIPTTKTRFNNRANEEYKKDRFESLITSSKDLNTNSLIYTEQLLNQSNSIYSNKKDKGTTLSYLQQTIHRNKPHSILKMIKDRLVSEHKINQRECNSFVSI